MKHSMHDTIEVKPPVYILSCSLEILFESLRDKMAVRLSGNVLPDEGDVLHVI